MVAYFGLGFKVLESDSGSLETSGYYIEIRRLATSHINKQVYITIDADVLDTKREILRASMHTIYQTMLWVSEDMTEQLIAQIIYNVTEIYIKKGDLLPKTTLINNVYQELRDEGHRIGQPLIRTVLAKMEALEIVTVKTSGRLKYYYPNSKEGIGRLQK